MPGFSNCFRFLALLFFAALFFTPRVFATVPIQERYLRELTATEARLKLISAAESLLGIPYRHGGLDRRGLDCSGLVYLSFREALNVTIPRTSESIFLWAAKIDTVDLQPGDLVFFVTSGSRISHVGIYVGGGRFIHSASSGPDTGVIVSRLTESYWRRTYSGAGRALPLDAETAMAFSAGSAGNTSSPERSVAREPVWADPGFIVGLAASWNWGGFSNGASSSPFRGVSAAASAGYKWSSFRAGLELRPEWDNTLGIFRLPITISMGTDNFQVFGGPVYTFGEPGSENNTYSGGNSWFWEAGISAALPPLTIKGGAVSLYGELAWQPYFRGNGESFEFNDLTANIRASTGLRYLWHLK